MTMKESFVFKKRGEEETTGGENGAKPTKMKGYFWSSIAGYTSFLIHAGNPPINFYVLPLKLDKISFIGTITLAFLVINLVKLIPYYYVGLLAPSNLIISLILLPLLLFINF